MKTIRFIVDIAAVLIIGCAVTWWIYRVSAHVFWGPGI
jgi:hypothetical protein